MAFTAVNFGTDLTATADRFATGPAVQPAKKSRRRHIDPTTCERDYRQDEIDFMRAMDDYKRSSGRMFPTCSEVLEVVRSLGYVRLSDEQREFIGDVSDESLRDDVAAIDADDDYDFVD